MDKIDIEKMRYADKHKNILFCNTCGETEPKHGFYPLFVHHEGRVSTVDCNCCRLGKDCPYCKEEVNG